MRKVFLLFFLLLVPVAFAGNFSIPYYSFGNVIVDNLSGNFSTSTYTTDQLLITTNSSHFSTCHGYFCWGLLNPFVIVPPGGGGANPNTCNVGYKLVSYNNQLYCVRLKTPNEIYIEQKQDDFTCVLVIPLLILFIVLRWLRKRGEKRVRR